MCYRWFAFLMLLTWGFMGCKGQQGLKGDSLAANRVQLLVQDAYSGRETEEHFMITDQKSLQKFFASINKTRKPGLPVPQVDFTNNKVWVYCAGMQKGTNEQLTFQREIEDRVVFKKVRMRNATKKEAITSPFYLYQVPKEAEEMVIE